MKDYLMNTNANEGDGSFGDYLAEEPAIIQAAKEFAHVLGVFYAQLLHENFQESQAMQLTSEWMALTLLEPVKIELPPEEDFE